MSQSVNPESMNVITYAKELHHSPEYTSIFMIKRGEGYTLTNLVSDVNIRVLSGMGYVSIDDEKKEIATGHVVDIPKCSQYKTVGNLALLTTITPGMVPDFVVRDGRPTHRQKLLIAMGNLQKNISDMIDFAQDYQRMSDRPSLPRWR